MLPYWPDVAGAPQNTIIGGATCGCCATGRAMNTRASQNSSASCRSRKFRPPGTRTPVMLPVTRAAFDLTRTQGFYERNLGTSISIEEITLKPPTENSRGVRLGFFRLIRDVSTTRLEQAFSSKKSAQAATSGFRGRSRQQAASSVRARELRSGNEGARAPRCVRQIQTSFSAVAVAALMAGY